MRRHTRILSLMVFTAVVGFIVPGWGKLHATPQTETDILVPGDYDGDGKADAAIVRAEDGLVEGVHYLNWYTNVARPIPPYWVRFSWGVSPDIPIAQDFDGDGKVDPSVYRPSTGHWYILRSGTNYSSYFEYVVDTTPHTGRGVN